MGVCLRCYYYNFAPHPHPSPRVTRSAVKSGVDANCNVVLVTGQFIPVHNHAGCEYRDCPAREFGVVWVAACERKDSTVGLKNGALRDSGRKGGGEELGLGRAEGLSNNIAQLRNLNCASGAVVVEYELGS